MDQRHIEAWFEEKNRPDVVDDDLPDYDKPVKKHCILGKFHFMHRVSHPNMQRGFSDYC